MLVFFEPIIEFRIIIILHVLLSLSFPSPSRQQCSRAIEDETWTQNLQPSVWQSCKYVISNIVAVSRKSRRVRAVVVLLRKVHFSVQEGEYHCIAARREREGKERGKDSQKWNCSNINVGY